MANFISPSTTIEEVAVGLNIANPAANTAGMVGEFSKGPCFEITSINSVQQLEETFGLPNSSNFKHWFTAWNFLQYANSLQVVRALDKTSLNAGVTFQQMNAVSTVPTSATTTRLNSSQLPTITFTTDEKLKFFYKSPGTDGNSYKVAVANYEDFDTIKLTHGTVTNGPFVVGNQVTIGSAVGTILVVGSGFVKVNKIFGTFATGAMTSGTTTATCSAVGAKAEAVTGVTFDSLYNFSLTSDNVLVVVTDSSNQVLEVFNTSLTVGKKDAGGSVIYINDYLERSSKYVYAYNNTSQAAIPATTSATALSGGTLTTPSNANIQECFDLYKNPDNSDIWVLMVGGYNENATIQKYAVQSIADVRKDLMVIVGPAQAEVVGVATESTTLTNVTKHRVNTFAVNSSYAIYLGNYKYQIDSYNSTNRWLPLDGDMAGLMIYAAENLTIGRFAWGLDNGKIKNINRLAWNPDKNSRDELWKKEIVSVNKFGSSNVVFGNKTCLGISNIFDVVDNRLLFNYIKRGLSSFLKYYLSEKNILTTQRRFTNTVEAFLNPLMGQGDIEEFKVDASDAINTADVKANNEFRAIVAVKPTSSIRYVKLSLYGLASNVSVDEVIVNNIG